MKTNIFFIVQLASFVFVCFSCHRAAESLSKNEMRNIVEHRNRDLAKCFKLGDAEKLAQMYSDSAKLSPNGYRFVVGRDSIKAFWAQDFKTSTILDMKTDILTVDGTADVIYETGISNSSIRFNDSVYHFTVKYINVWKKQPDGIYLLDIDFWNKAK